VRNGPASIAFVPEKDPSCIIIVIKPGLKPRGLLPQEEFSLLEKLQELKGEHFVTPTPHSCDNDPAYIAMGRLGQIVGWNFSAPNEVKKIGTAVGEFAGLLFLAHGAIHTDICPSNYTNEPDGKIGIIDIASIEKDIPEKMFLTPLLDPFNICPAMAEKFEQVTGRPIDFDVVEKLSKERLGPLLKSKTPEEAEMIKGRHDANLEEWRNLRSRNSEEITCYRPGPKNRIRNFRRDI